MVNVKRLCKIVFPAAGMGTRFLPATKAIPKEMLTIVDKPLIQYGVEEALASGMDEVLIITGRGKNAIEDHFDISSELEANLLAAGKDEIFKKVSHIARMANIAYTRQKKALGLGHAVLCAAPWVGDEAFGVSLADELILADEPAMQQLRAVYEATGCSVIGLAEVPHTEVHKYGIVKAEQDGERLRLLSMIEKPSPDYAPSNLAIVGRYIFTPRLFDHLKNTKAGVNSEIQLTDAINQLAGEEHIYGVVLNAQRFDAGNPGGFLAANAVLGLQHPEYGENLRALLATQLATSS
ncbi:MAG: UTP--glucose-1-phosphate uridylyltransferase GalU [Mariprofundaceae bacterium]|nr:UTP--glucose-1-phosphate uridylyltransferase GalU [Mariprofundaceae bacterium]